MASVESAHEKRNKLKPDEVRITNVVSDSSLGQPIDRAAVAVAMKGRFNPALFPAVVVYCITTQASHCQFRGGNLVTAGTKTEADSLFSAYLYARTLQERMGLNVNIYNFEINNVVAHFYLGYEFNMDLFYMDHQMYAKWEPENFQGMGFKPLGEAKGVFSFVLFKSGKGIITGGKSTEGARAVYRAYRDLFAKYKVGAEYRVLGEGEGRLRNWAPTNGKSESKKNGANSKKRKAASVSVSKLDCTQSSTNSEDCCINS